MIMRRMKMLPMKNKVRGFLALALLAEAGLFSAGCATRQEARTIQKEHVVLLRVKAKKANVVPDILVISGYGSGAENQIIWTFKHKKTVITFKDHALVPDPTCDNNPQIRECTLTLPKGLLPNGVDSKQFKYTVNGEDDNGPLEPNDPWIEIDR
jgi:hypothetical protein